VCHVQSLCTFLSPFFLSEIPYRVIPGNRNWQIKTADWNLDVRLDIWVQKLYARLEILLRNWLAGSKTVVSISRDDPVSEALVSLRTVQRIHLIKRRSSSLERGKETSTVPMNLHGVGRSARPTSKWAGKAHRMIEKRQKGYCERSFGTNVHVLQ